MKVEPPDGDPSRGGGPFDAGDSAYFHVVNRGKESLAGEFHEAVDATQLTPDDLVR